MIYIQRFQDFIKFEDDLVKSSDINFKDIEVGLNDILESFIEIDQFTIDIRYQKDKLQKSDIFIYILYDPVINSIKNPMGDMIIKRIMSEFGYDLSLIDHNLWWTHTLRPLVKHKIHLTFK